MLDSEIEYPIILIKDGDEYVACHPDLPGCVSFGSTPTDACENLVEVKRLWIEGQVSGGVSIPSPCSFFGTWPGDETDADLLAALEKIRR